jgi:transposase/uncharacterized protein YjbI with pentapeptide repeats
VPSPKLVPLVLSDAERASLEALSRKRTASQSLAERARVVLACAEESGVAPLTRVAERTGVSRETVRKWRVRFMEGRMGALGDAPRPGAPRKITDEQVEVLVTRTLTEKGPGQDTHWSTRSMAAETGLSQSSVSRIWRAFGLKPHLVETWKLSTDPEFIAKVRDVVGLYMSPPEHALVLAVDEKSQIQALDRTAPCLPMLPTTPQRRTHDYVRNGTTSLFAAYDLASGSVIAQHYRRHRSQEFLRFLKLIDAAVPRDLDLHLVLDNYATHKTPEVKAWLLRHPRFCLHFTPTSSSWLNLVERWFAELTTRKLRRSAHRSVTELEADIRRWISEWNKDPKPFVWTKSADEILETIAEYCQRISSPQDLGETIMDDDLRSRWDSAEGVLLAGEVLGRLRAGDSLGGLGLGEVDGRVDLRGLPAPQPSPAARRNLAEVRAGRMRPEEAGRGLERVELVGVGLRGLDLSGALLDKVTIRGCVVEDCVLDGVHGHGLGIARSTVRDTSFRDADLRDGGGLMGRAGGVVPEFDRVDFSGADLRKWGQMTAWFRDCDFSGARLDECSFIRCGLVRCRFSGVMREVLFRGGQYPDGREVPDHVEDVDMSGAAFRHVIRNDFVSYDEGKEELAALAESVIRQAERSCEP